MKVLDRLRRIYRLTCAQEHVHEVVVLEGFSSGHAWAVKGCEFLRVDFLYQDKLAELLKGRELDIDTHFAA